MFRVPAYLRRFVRVTALKLRKLIVRANAFRSPTQAIAQWQLRCTTYAEHSLGTQAAYALRVATARQYEPEAYRNPEYG